jgi:hypothetical protein
MDADASVRIFPYGIMIVLPGANDFRKPNCGKQAKWCAPLPRLVKALTLMRATVQSKWPGLRIADW